MLGEGLGLWPGAAGNGLSRRASSKSASLSATDLADYLVKKGSPSHDAHEAASHVVKVAMGRGVDLAELPVSDLQAVNGQITADLAQVLTLKGSVDASQGLGGTAPATPELHGKAPPLRAFAKEGNS